MASRDIVFELGKKKTKNCVEAQLSNGSISKKWLAIVSDDPCWQMTFGALYLSEYTLFPQGWMCSIHTKPAFTFTVLDLIMGMLLCLHNLL